MTLNGVYSTEQYVRFVAYAYMIAHLINVIELSIKIIWLNIYGLFKLRGV